MTQDKFEALINGQKIPRERLAEMFDKLTELATKRPSTIRNSKAQKAPWSGKKWKNYFVG
jgi:hypothetical protein